MRTLSSRITIAGKEFAGVNDVQISRSVYEIAASATIKVPVTAVLKSATEPPARIEVAQAVRPGDEVVIELGYDGVLKTEFRGYVKLLNLKTPLEIVCEDEFYKTRSENVTIQGGATTLAEVLRICGLKVAECASLTLESFPVDNKPASWVLGKLKANYGLNVFFDLDGQVYACKPFSVRTGDVRYKLRWNVIKDDDLEFHRAEDKNVKVKAVCIYTNGQKEEQTAGPADGTEKTMYFYDVADSGQLAELAEAALTQLSYDGYSGKIETFLIPYAAPSMTAVIEDDVYSERNGRYYIESVEVKFGRQGARRTVEIGIKV